MSLSPLSPIQAEVAASSAQAFEHEPLDRSRNAQPLEIYLFHAFIERLRESRDPRPIPDSPWTVIFKKITGRGSSIVYPNGPISAPNTTSHGEEELKVSTPVDEKAETPETESPASRVVTFDIQTQKQTAYRLLRVASWQVVFFLVTTDVLGPVSAPMAFAELGYGPGVLVYSFFFILAFASGQILWRMYLHLDSEVYPITCYADIGERTFGPFVRHLFNILQSLQLLFNVAVLIVGNGQALAAIINYKFCYVGLNVLWAVAGALVGQIKRLRSFAPFTTINIFLSLTGMGIVLAGIATYPPIPQMSGHLDLAEPIIRSGWVPSYTVGWYSQVGGVQLAVFAYGGAMIFPEFLAEMRRPNDFWKAAFFSQFLCYSLYMFFGLFVYSYQGQYTSILPSLNFANAPLQLAANVIGLVATGIAGVLYANIGVKVFYQNVLREYFNAPALTTRHGSIIWSITMSLYWVFAWVVGSAVPNLNALVTLIGAACILQFTYTFPPILLLGFWVQKDAIVGDRPWQPGQPAWSNRVDTWRDVSRWKRGFALYWYAKVGLVLIFLAALSLAGLGIYAGVEIAIQAFDTSATTSFSCRAPGQP